MLERETTLQRRLESIVGSENVGSGTACRIDGLVPELLVRPASSDETAACLMVCGEAEAAVAPAGAMTWLESGNPLRRANVLLCLDRMCRVVDYSPADLTATVEAGLSIKTLNEVARRERQWLPLNPPGYDRASLGAVAACASSGYLRFGFGSPRDYVIGLRLAHADGSQSKSGGKVVKNVAGYDMNKLYVGSFGTLAVLTELTLKLRPYPESIATAVIAGDSISEMFDAARRIMASDLRPVSVLLTNVVTPSLCEVNTGSWLLLIRFADDASSVAHQMRRIQAVARAGESVAREEDDLLWTEIGDAHQTEANVVRMSSPVSSVESLVDRALEVMPRSSVQADVGAGSVRVAFDSEDETAGGIIRGLRTSAEGLGGVLTIERSDLATRRQIDTWGEVGPTVTLMRSIKARFDPNAILNPGRFVAGI